MADINKYIKKSNTIRTEGTPLMRELLEEYREKASEINSDPYITGKGKQRDIALLKKQYERKVIELAGALKAEERKALAEARKLAEKTLTAQLPEVDKTKAKLFLQKSDALQSRVLFSTNSKDATEALRELVNAADEAALAADIKPRVLELSQQVIASAKPNEVIGLKKALGDVYKDVSNRSLPEGSQAAKDALNMVKSIENNELFTGLVRDSMREISPITSEYINKPDAYAEKHGGNNE